MPGADDQQYSQSKLGFLSAPKDKSQVELIWASQRPLTIFIYLEGKENEGIPYDSRFLGHYIM